MKNYKDAILYVEIMVVYRLSYTSDFPYFLLNSVGVRSEISYLELFPPVSLGYFFEIIFLIVIFFCIYSVNSFILLR